MVNKQQMGKLLLWRYINFFAPSLLTILKKKKLLRFFVAECDSLTAIRKGYKKAAVKIFLKFQMSPRTQRSPTAAGTNTIDVFGGHLPKWILIVWTLD